MGLGTWDWNGMYKLCLHSKVNAVVKDITLLKEWLVYEYVDQFKNSTL